ncbi:MAG: NnrS family protein, partial [Maritimibacter sp.]|nr:NnrS family protein [Maritimibacter sp.]
LVIGGRVGPAFTRNAMHRDGVPETDLPRDWPGFTPVMIALAALLPVSALVLPETKAAGLVALAAGLGQLIRQSRWGFGYAIRRPILAALHVSAGLVGIGLVLSGLVPFTGLSEVAALHLLAIGGVAGMTLAVMSRATLGHTGRPLVAPRPVAVAYALLPLAALLRWLGSELAGAVYFPAILAAGFLWILAFGLYTGALLPAFLGPRADR